MMVFNQVLYIVKSKQDFLLESVDLEFNILFVLSLLVWLLVRVPWLDVIFLLIDWHVF